LFSVCYFFDSLGFVISLFKLNNCSVRGEFYSINNILKFFSISSGFQNPIVRSLSLANLFLFDLGLALASLRFRLRQFAGYIWWNYSPQSLIDNRQNHGDWDEQTLLITCVLMSEFMVVVAE